MSEPGTGFSVRLQKLDAVGAVDLPDARDHITTARKKLLEVEASVEASSTGASDLLEPLAEPARLAFATLARALQENASNVDLSADAILEIKKRYEKLEGLD